MPYWAPLYNLATFTPYSICIEEKRQDKIYKVVLYSLVTVIVPVVFLLQDTDTEVTAPSEVLLAVVFLLSLPLLYLLC